MGSSRWSAGGPRRIVVLTFTPLDMPTKHFPRIAEVRAYSKGGAAEKVESGKQGSDCHDVPSEHWINGNGTMWPPIANPMSCWPQYQNKARTGWGINALGSCIVEVIAEDGTSGIGVTTAGEPGCYIVENHLSRFVEGEDPRNVEQIWDKMWRSTINYGRKGLPLQAISAVDLAIWDLLGKLRNEPVWALLGGMTKERCPVYCTTARPDLVKKMGFAGAKIPCPYGPADGDEGFRKNVEFFAKCMTACGSKASHSAVPLSPSPTVSLTHNTRSRRAQGGGPRLPTDARLLHGDECALHDKAREGACAARPQVD